MRNFHTSNQSFVLHNFFSFDTSATSVYILVILIYFRLLFFIRTALQMRDDESRCLAHFMLSICLSDKYASVKLVDFAEDHSATALPPLNLNDLK
jgi:hypothetical protein